MTIPTLTIIICTHNRAGLLPLCLDSLGSQTASAERFTILVVDNASTDHTRELVATYRQQYPHLDYVYEPITGLSHARNRGYLGALTPWVLYIDDDARALPDLVEQALSTIEHEDFDAFGGRFVHWFYYGQPRWFPADFEGGGRPTMAEQATLLGPGEFFNGGIMAFRRSVLVDAGGFSTDYGMRGEMIAYGEESELQVRLRQSGYRLGYDPHLVIEHLVRPEKLRLGWHLRSRYAHGRDEVTGQDYGLGKLLADLLYTAFIITPKALLKWLIKPAYYWQQAVLETVGYVCYCWGRYRGGG